MSRNNSLPPSPSLPSPPPSSPLYQNPLHSDLLRLRLNNLNQNSPISENTESSESTERSRPQNNHENIGSPLVFRSFRTNFNENDEPYEYDEYSDDRSDEQSNEQSNEGDDDDWTDFSDQGSDQETKCDELIKFFIIENDIFNLNINQLNELKQKFLQFFKETSDNHKISTYSCYINFIDKCINNLFLEEDSNIIIPINSSKTMLKENYLKNTCNYNLLNENLNYLNNNCNNCEGIYGEYNDSDIDELVTIKFLNSEKQYEKGICFTKSEFRDYVHSSYNEENPSNIQAIYTKPLKPQKIEDYISGMTSKATGRIVIKIPSEFSPFVTLNCAHKILQNNDNKIWYALPLFGGKKRRIGGIQSQLIVSGNHGQTPGYIIYKLYTKEEINQDIIVEEKASDYPLSLFLFEPMMQLDFILGLNNLKSEQIYKNFINGIIYFLLKRW